MAQMPAFEFVAPLVEAARAEVADPDAGQVGVEVFVEDQAFVFSVASASYGSDPR